MGESASKIRKHGCLPPNLAFIQDWHHSNEATHHIERCSNSHAPSSPLRRFSILPDFHAFSSAMPPPLVTQAPLSFSVVFNIAQLATSTLPLCSAIPGLGEGWHLFWRTDAQGALELGVTGGVVKKNWESIRFEVKVPQTGRAFFNKSTSTAGIIGETWPGFLCYAENYTLYPGYQYVATLEVKLSSAEIQDLPTSSPLGISTAAMHQAQYPNDVKFSFSPSNLVLWGNVQSLSAASPYFQTLFNSGFAESTPIEGKGKGRTARSAKKVERDFDDSDDETDKFILARDANQVASNSSPEFDVPFRLVEINESAYTTYLAVLCWIDTGHITFAPLRSSFRLQSDPKWLRNASLIESLVTASHPLPASPKSIYRLAHFLELDGLVKIAFSNIQSQLTKEIIAYEVFGDVALAYDAIGEMELDFAVKEWAYVKVSEAMKDVGAMANRGELPSFSSMSFKLCQRLSW